VVEDWLIKLVVEKGRDVRSVTMSYFNRSAPVQGLISTVVVEISQMKDTLVPQPLWNLIAIHKNTGMGLQPFDSSHLRRVLLWMIGFGRSLLDGIVSIEFLECIACLGLGVVAAKERWGTFLTDEVLVGSRVLVF
jgi:hypothetical protein